MEIIKAIRQKSEEFMKQSSFSGHDYEHVMRVYNLAKKIGTEEGADLLVLEAASLMHDLEPIPIG